MKKHPLKLISLFLALILLSTAFSSCASLAMKLAGEEARPMKLYELAMEYMDELENATLITDSRIDVYLGREHVVSTVHMVEQIDGSGEDLLHQQRSHTQNLSQGYLTESSTFSGFQNGTMYFTGTTEGGAYTGSQLQASISAEEYVKYLNGSKLQNDIDLDFSADECGSATCEKNEDGKWVGTYTDFAQSYIDRVLTGLVGMEIIFSEYYAVADIVITLSASSDLDLERVDVAFEFKSINSKANTTAPIFTTSLEITAQNDTEIEKIDLSAFKNVDDLRYINQVQIMAGEIATKDAGKFTLSTKSEYTLGDVSKTQDQRLALSFSTPSSGYFYQLSMDSEQTSYRIVYSDGEQNVYYDNNSKPYSTKDSSDTAAKQFVYATLVPTDFQPTDVIDVKKAVSDGTVVYTVQVSSKAAQDTVKKALGSKARNESFTETYTFHIKDGKLTKYTYAIDCTFAQEGETGIYSIVLVGQSST